MSTEKGHLEPGTRVRRRYGDPNRTGTVQYKVGYIDNEQNTVMLVWRYVKWDSGKSTVFRTIDLMEAEESSD